MVDNTAHAVPDQETRNTEAKEDTKEGQDCDPFLLGIRLLQPRLLNLAFLDQS